MAQRCSITNKGPISGNKVSHSNRKSRRVFNPNLQEVSFATENLGTVRLRVAASTIRTIDHNGGLEAYLLNTSNLKLAEEAKKPKRQLLKRKKTA